MRRNRELCAGTDTYLLPHPHSAHFEGPEYGHLHDHHDHFYLHGGLHPCGYIHGEPHRIPPEGVRMMQDSGWSGPTWTVGQQPQGQFMGFRGPPPSVIRRGSGRCRWDDGRRACGHLQQGGGTQGVIVFHCRGCIFTPDEKAPFYNCIYYLLI